MALPKRGAGSIQEDMTRVAILGVGLVCTQACAMSHDVGGDAAAQLLPIQLDARCQKELDVAPYGLPEHLSCTGLYSDTEAREVAETVMHYVPAHRLWSDGLNKERYVFLPEETQIDASDSDAWRFPIGTRFWKEFQEPDSRRPVETRLYWKKDQGEWKQTTYAWDDGLTDATRVDMGEDITLSDGQRHWLPGPNDCEECHKGRRDRALGFEQVALGLPEAQDVTLQQLLDQGQLSGFEGPTSYQIGPDDSSAEAEALGWMHMNCGVTCHNDNPNRTGQAVDMVLTLRADELDGRSTQDFEAVVTTVDQDTQTLQWLGRTRVVPGSPDESWLYSLITARNPGGEEQMPPIGTFLVDPDGSEAVREWIESLGAP